MRCPVLQLQVTPFCCALVLQRGLQVAPSRDLWDALFLEKLLVETQAVIELSSFGKGTILPHLECTANPLPQPAESLGLTYSLWPHPAESSHTVGWLECCAELGVSKHHLPWRLLSRIRWVGAGLYDYITGATPIFPVSSAQATLEGEEVSAPLLYTMRICPPKSC